MNHIEIINNWNLDRIFQELEQGNMRIPRFQRSFVWERSKIVKLLNSIYYEFPIGSFFLWDTDTKMEGFCRDISELGFPEKPEANKFSFILDGQQRITSLYVALKGKKFEGIDYSSICFNLDKRVFKIPTLKTEQHNIPVWRIYDKKEFGSLLIKYASSGDSERAERLQECRDILDHYPVSIIKSKEMGLEEVVAIFERINQGGKRLSLFDLVHASVWSNDFDLREKVGEFNKEKAISFFGRIDNEIFTQSLALNVSQDCVKQHQLALNNKDCKDYWDRTVECIRLAVDFMKNNWGVQSIEIIPYQNIIPVVQYYFFVTGGASIKQEHVKALTDWFWTLTFSTRYSSSTLTKMKEDALWIQQLAQDAQTQRIFTVKLGLEDLKKIKMGNRSVIKNGILCLMALNHPVDFDNGTTVTLDKTNASRLNSKENHHFFPYSLASALHIKQDAINSLLNFAFISKRLNLLISNKYPSDYLKAFSEQNPSLVENLESHFILPEAYNAALADSYLPFLEERGKCILEMINKVCRVNDNVQTLNSDLDGDDEEDFWEEAEDRNEEEPPRYALRKSFWSGYVYYCKEHNGLQAYNMPTTNSWISKGVGVYGVGLNICISYNYARVEIYIDTKDNEKNKRIFNFFESHKSTIENTYGSSLTWEQLPDKRACRIKDQRNYNCFNLDDKTEIFEFLCESSKKMNEAFKPFFQASNNL